MSYSTSTGTAVTKGSAAHARHLRRRLRASGALPSSRSIMSRHEELIDEEVLDVGDNKHANLVEHLLARLEQHGLRRCFCEDEPTSIYGVAPHVDDTAMTTPPQSLDPTHPDAREAYYYCCVPCELRLTVVSSSAATMRMLQDAHHHFSSVRHRHAAALMGDPDVDTTLVATPLVEQPYTYTRVFVNGLPMLMSRRPGGGDLFYPLPFEEEACGYCPDDGEAPGRHGYPPHDGDDRPDLYRDGTPRPRVLPPPSTTPSTHAGARVMPVFWYNPTQSLFTGTRQVPHLDTLARADPMWRRDGLRQVFARTHLDVHHVPLASYRTNAGVDIQAVPLEPQLFALTPRILRSSNSNPESSLPQNTRKRPRGDGEHAVEQNGGSASVTNTVLPVYAQVPQTVEVVVSEAPAQTDDNTAAAGAVSLTRCTVHADGVYRVALQPPVSDALVQCRSRVGRSTELDHAWTNDTAGVLGPDGPADAVAVPLTEEALRRHTASLATDKVTKAARAMTSYFSVSSRSRDTVSLFDTASANDDAASEAGPTAAPRERASSSSDSSSSSTSPTSSTTDSQASAP